MRVHRRVGRLLVAGLGVIVLTGGVTVEAGVPVAVAGEPHDAARAAAVTGVAGSGSNQPRAAVAPGSRPNIVLITSDDQSASDMRYMPRTRKLLGAAGITFPGAISPHPLCCPARAQILTGEYAQNNGVHHNRGGWGGYGRFEKVNGDDHLGTWLQKAGYRTAFAGKTMNGYHPSNYDRPGGWTHWNPVYGPGLYKYFRFSMWEDGKRAFYKRQHIADTLASTTAGYIEKFSRDRKPFFIWASHPGPHTSPDGKGKWTDPVPAARHRKSFPRLPLPQAGKPSFGAKDDVSDLPRFVRRQAAPRFTTKADIATSTANLRRLNQARARNLLSIDEGNARIITALKRAGELENTVVIYTSDNGYMLGEHRLSGKNYVYEENMKVPLLMRGPGMPAGTTNPAPMATVDLAPTMLDLAGTLGSIRARGRTDGITMLPVLRHPEDVNPTTLIQAGGDHRPWTFRGVRTERYTWVEWFDGETELYDRVLDPFQMRNLGGPGGTLRDARYRDVDAGLRTRYEALRSCRGVQECELRDFAPLPPPSQAGVGPTGPSSSNPFGASGIDPDEGERGLPGGPATGWEWSG